MYCLFFELFVLVNNYRHNCLFQDPLELLENESDLRIAYKGLPHENGPPGKLGIAVKR